MCICCRCCCSIPVLCRCVALVPYFIFFVRPTHKSRCDVHAETENPPIRTHLVVTSIKNWSTRDDVLIPWPPACWRSVPSCTNNQSPCSAMLVDADDYYGCARVLLSVMGKRGASTKPHTKPHKSHTSPVYFYWHGTRHIRTDCPIMCLCSDAHWGILWLGTANADTFCPLTDFSRPSPAHVYNMGAYIFSTGHVGGWTHPCILHCVVLCVLYIPTRQSSVLLLWVFY